MPVSPRISRIALVLALAFGLGGCATAGRAGPAPVPSTAEAADDRWRVERLYLGRAIPGGGAVGDAEWAAFLREVVTPRFPDGLTTFATQGQWRGADGQVVREDAFLLELVHAYPAAEAAELVREIAAAYRLRFRQEAVLWTRDRVEVTLLSDP